jgi:glycosyltransferase involved in cell wall biosynthesis
MKTPKLVVITPVRNEEAFLRKTIDSILRQTLLPAEWIIVDDGSSDGTANIVSEVANIYPWIKLVKKSDRGRREVGGGVVDAIYHGLAHISVKEYDYLSKLDGDVVLGQKYIETLIQKFTDDPRLGIASGIVVQEEAGKVVRRRCVREFAYGPARIWKRECFDDVGQLFRSAGWDSLDCYKAMEKGWKTWVFDDSELEIFCLRRIGSSERSLLHGYLRDGRSAYFRKDHPLYLIFSGIFRMADPPYLICGVCRLMGYLVAAAKNSPQCPDESLVLFLRKWQLEKLVKGVKDKIFSH